MMNEKSQAAKAEKTKFRIVKPLFDGLKMTFIHLFRPRATLSYPEKKMKMFPRFRGLHHLHTDPKTGLDVCVACGLCAAICPSECISVQGAEREDHSKYPEKFVINLGRCIFCGFCVEVCPKGAISMGPEYELADDSRNALILNKEDLLKPPKES
jgi:NADH-quinone oxidoreductase subunit I